MNPQSLTNMAKVVEDSISPSGRRLTTLQLRYPRFIHAEVLTHRDRSRNASSSRAIPVKRMVSMTQEDPAFFCHVGVNIPGMQAQYEVSDQTKDQFRKEWVELMNIVAGYVTRWGSSPEEGGYGIHKQVANRALEPWQYISVVMTSTYWDNFFELRDHEDAQPEFHALASQIRSVMAASAPVLRDTNPHLAENWHLPYVTAEERASTNDPRHLARLSTARCARVSYLKHDGSAPSAADDLMLYERLVGGVPLHASPVEHQGYPLVNGNEPCKNFLGWKQHRFLVEEELWGRPPVRLA